MDLVGDTVEIPFLGQANSGTGLQSLGVLKGLSNPADIVRSDIIGLVAGGLLAGGFLPSFLIWW